MYAGLWNEVFSLSQLEKQLSAVPDAEWLAAREEQLGWNYLEKFPSYHAKLAD